MSTSFYPVIGLQDRTKMADITDTHRRQTGQEVRHNQQRTDSAMQRAEAVHGFASEMTQMGLGMYAKEEKAIGALAAQVTEAKASVQTAKDQYDIADFELNEKRIQQSSLNEGAPEHTALTAIINNMANRQRHRKATIDNLESTYSSMKSMYDKRSDTWINRLMRDEEDLAVKSDPYLITQSDLMKAAPMSDIGMLTPPTPMEVATAEELAPPPYVPPKDPYPNMPDSHGFGMPGGAGLDRGDLLPSGAITFPADNPYGNIGFDDSAGTADRNAAVTLKEQGVVEDINMGLLNIGAGTQPITPYDLADLGIAVQVLRALTKDPSKRKQKIAMLVNAIYVAMQSSPKKKHHRRY